MTSLPIAVNTGWYPYGYTTDLGLTTNLGYDPVAATNPGSSVPTNYSSSPSTSLWNEILGVAVPELSGTGSSSATGSTSAASSGTSSSSSPSSTNWLLYAGLGAVILGALFLVGGKGKRRS